MASQDSTTVYIDGMTPFKLNRGEYEELVLAHDQPKRIFADQPILVVQYSQSREMDLQRTVE